LWIGKARTTERGLSRGRFRQVKSQHVTSKQLVGRKGSTSNNTPPVESQDWGRHLEKHQNRVDYQKVVKGSIVLLLLERERREGREVRPAWRANIDQSALLKEGEKRCQG